MRKITVVLAFAVLAACAKKTVPEGTVKGISKFQLSGGAAISQPGVDEYNPYVLQTGDNFLVLVFGSNRSCGGCTGHNLFIARSTTAYNNDAVFPAFESPAVVTVTGTPLNYTNPIAFAPTLTGNNVRIFLTNAGGTVQQTAAITPGGSSDTTLTNIANTAGLNSTVIGVEFTGTKLYTRQNGTLYSFNHASAADPLVAMATGQTAASLASVDGAFTSRYDGFFSLIDGTIAGMSLYGMGGNVEKVNTAIAKARLSSRFMSVMRGGGFNGGLMFISGVESGGTTQDLYVVDGLTVWQMWQALNPKPPAAPGSGSTPVETTVANPAFSPVAGTYGTPLSLTITSTTSSATICYTSNGVDPVCDATPACTTGTAYTAPVGLGYFTGTAKAIACKAGLTNSSIVSAAYVSDNIQPSAPGGFNTFVTAPGEIYLSWTAGSDNLTATGNLVYEICQTLVNGGCNTFTATYTTAAAALNRNVTGLAASTTYYFRARTRDEVGNVSGYTAQVSGTTLAAPTVNAPTFSPVAGTYNATQNVTISTTTGSATICYTTDGNTPACDATPTCTTGSTYSGTVAISTTGQLRAIGCRNGYTSSSITSGTYTIDTSAPVISATSPSSSSSPTNTQVSYTLSEACASGSITWTRTGGTADAGSPHVRSLVGSELTAGSHISITLTNNPTLFSGTIYSVAFNCTDAAGNAATTVTNTNVTYNPSASPRLWEAEGTVYTTTLSGTTLYVGGSFTFVGNSYGNGVSIDAGTSRIPSGTTPPRIAGSVNAVAPDGSGGWYIAGTFTSVGGLTRNRLARINSNGTVHAWNPNANNDVYTLVVSGGIVYVGGVFTTIGASSRNRIAAIDGTTGATTTWDPGANSAVRALAVSGSIVYAGGDFLTIGGSSRNRLAALDTSTGSATAWNPNVNAGVYALAVSGTTVYVGGTFADVGGLARNYVAAVDTTTGTATSWNPNANGQVYALTVSGSTIYAGGAYSNIGGQVRPGLAALNNTTGTASAWNPNMTGSTVYAVAVSGSTVYVGGDFTNIGGQARNKIAAIDASTGNATSWDPGASNTVYCVAVSGTTIYIGGLFQTAPGKIRNRIAAIDTTTGEATSWDPNAGGIVRSIAVSGSTVYIAGQFTTIGGQARNRIAAANATTGAITNWNPNAGNTVFSIALSGTTLFAGGSFGTIGGQTRQFIAALDTTVDTNNATAWTCNGNNTVISIAISGTTLYVGGSFTAVGGQARNRIAAISTTTGIPTSWNPNASFTVNSITLDGSLVYAAGDFNTIGGATRNYAAALDASTGTASAWNPNPSHRLHTISASGSTVYLGGEFSTVGGQARTYLAAVDSTTGTPTTLNITLNGYVYSLIASASVVYVAGDFVPTASPRRMLASLDPVSGNMN